MNLKYAATKENEITSKKKLSLLLFNPLMMYELIFKWMQSIFLAYGKLKSITKCKQC